MLAKGEGDLGQLLHAARAGDREALGTLLDRYRSYLMLLARIQIDRRLQGKADAADLVQETFLQAHRSFAQFRGRSEEQLLGWLREILGSKIVHLMRRYLDAQCRDARLERELENDLDNSSQEIAALVSPESSPSQRASRREQAVLLAEAIDSLPADYREVIVLHQLQGLPCAEVARRMGRTVDGVEKLWVRALAAVQTVFRGKCDD